MISVTWSEWDLKLARWFTPLTIFGVCFFSFGLLQSRLGFFQDDWHHVYYAYWEGAEGLQRFLLVDRGPFAWIVYALFFKILGYSPTSWHWSLMLIRCATALMFWLSLRLIWPEQRGLTSWLALLFIVYPIFTLQSLAVAYTLHWSMYLVFMVSLFLTLKAVQSTTGRFPLTLVALALEAMHLIFIEYFSGLELCRPIFIWLMLGNVVVKDRLKTTLKIAIPYTILFGLYILYRSSYGVLFGFDRFALLATLSDLARAPLTNLANTFQFMLQDLLYVVLSPWHAALDPGLIELTRPSTYVMFGSMAAFSVMTYFLFMRYGRNQTEDGFQSQGARVAAAGLFLVIFAILPFWLSGFSIFQKNQLWSQRLALAAMPGASMLIVGGVYALVDRDRYRHLVLSVLLGLGIGLQVQTARSFQASWDKQKQFFWQLHWRAPALQPNTLIVADQEILFYMGIYPTAFSINLLYPQLTQPPNATYWFNAGFEHINFDRIRAGQAITFEKYTTTYTGTVQDVLAITFEPGKDQCLWILSPRLANARVLSPQASTWLAASHPSRIQASPERIPPSAIFGSEPPRTWCYYYEKADLASQFKDWSGATGLWREAGTRGLRAANGIELLPFIEAYGWLGDWEQAQEITLQAETLPDRSTSVLCDLWNNLNSNAPASAQRDQTSALVQSRLGCQN